jgi:hypothetical protein
MNTRNEMLLFRKRNKKQGIGAKVKDEKEGRKKSNEEPVG